MRINCYHSGDRVQWIPFYKKIEDVNSDLLKVGIEIECEFGTDDDGSYDGDEDMYVYSSNYENIADNIEQFSNGEINFILEEDGSLSHDSFELITRPVFYAQDNKNDIGFLESALNIISPKLIPQNSGTHFHIDKRNIFPKDISEDICKAIVAIVMNKFKDDLFKISKRDDIRKMNNYASFKELDLEICSDIKYIINNTRDILSTFSERYCAINFQPEYTIEFRFFGATKSYKDLEEMLNNVYNIRKFFVNNMYNIYNGQININDITFTQFINGEIISVEPMKVGTILYTRDNEPFVIKAYNPEEKTYLIVMCSDKRKKYIIDISGYIVANRYLGKIFSKKRVLKKGEDIYMKTFEEIIKEFKLKYDRTREIKEKLYILLNRETQELYIRIYSASEMTLGGFVMTSEFDSYKFKNVLQENEITMANIEAYMVEQYLKEIEQENK